MNLPIKAKGESLYTKIYGWSSVIMVLIFLAYLIILMPLKTKIFPVLLLLFILWILRKAIRSVVFSDSDICVHYLYGKRITVCYSDLVKFYKNKEGLIPAYVYVIEYKRFESSKLAKFTFYIENLNFKEFQDFLVRMRDKKS